MVPFTREHQDILIAGFHAIVLDVQARCVLRLRLLSTAPETPARPPPCAQGPVQLISYAEGFPDPAAPPNISEKVPYVDLAVRRRRWRRSRGPARQ